MPKQKKTGTNLSIQTTLQLLADVDKKQGTKKEIAEKYGIPHNTLYINDREKQSQVRETWSGG